VVELLNILNSVAKIIVDAINNLKLWIEEILSEKERDSLIWPGILKSNETSCFIIITLKDVSGNIENGI
jgi:hypothetical protein